jgi:hypothetical protein
VSLLPEVQRELLRVARAPLRDGGPGVASPRGRTPRLVAVAGVTVLALAIGAVFLSALRTGGARHTAAAPAGANRARSALARAPRTQRGDDAGEDDAGLCPLAARNRYLPPLSGCVTALRADVDGDGRPDLVIVYSRLSPRPIGSVAPARLRHDHRARRAFLRVVRDGGGTVTARLPAAAASVLAVARVNDEPGAEVLLRTGGISSGSWGVAYGMRGGRLVPAGVTLNYGGDSISRSGFNCLAGSPPRLVQRSFEALGSLITAPWRVTAVTYAWHGPRLVRVAKRTFTRPGPLPARASTVGAGCRRGVG